MKRLFVILAVIVVIILVIVILLRKEKQPEPGTVLDEAQTVGRSDASLAGADEDYFRDMDKGLTKNPALAKARLEPFVPGITEEAAVKAVATGRNNWIVWTAGNDRFWDEIGRRAFGAIDLLKTLSNHPSLDFSRDNRWEYLGIVNEPGFSKGTGPRADREGLWLDVRDPDAPPDPFENETKYPGVKIGARGDTLPVGSYYGYATGVVGLRLFPNPEFDEAARKKWDPDRFYTDASYYNDNDLVRPYRVGMSCGFCHVGPNPVNPPADPEHPTWANLSSNPGAQYFWIDRIFVWDVDTSSFVWQLFHTSRPGALDTSLVSSDNINNPRTMNAVYSLAARLENAKTLDAKETLAGGGLDNAQLNDYVPSGPLTEFFEEPATVWTPRVLKDGSDSVGALGALNRVFVNIGLFSEEWFLHFRALVGGRDITPFPIATARENSAYWRATEAQTPDLALFFLATATPDRLADAPGSAKYLQASADQLRLGKEVFAERCARCHSSKLPGGARDFFPNGSAGKGYLDSWNEYWQWTKTDEFKSQIKEIVLADDFLEGNYLSTELRVPVTLLETNAGSPLATNAIENDIWDNFSSRSYKDLPSVGTITVHHPLTGEPYPYEMPAGGRGYTRPASLISLWSTAPYLLNNTVGEFYWTGSVDDRMKSFEDGIEKMLWPERRKGDRLYVTASGKMAPAVIDVTTQESYLKIAHGFLPDPLRKALGWRRFLPWVDPADMTLEIGPIPAGTPINLLANLDTRAPKRDVVKTVLRLIPHLKKAKKNSTMEDVWSPVVDDLLKINKSPDFLVNRGHYFGTDFLPESEGEPGLTAEQKLALIEFLKTF